MTTAPGVVQLGMSRSGSTAAWQACRALVRGTIDARDGGAVSKAHRYVDRWREVPHVVTVRDPLDCAASWVVADAKDPAAVDAEDALHPAMASAWQVLEGQRRARDLVLIRYERWWDDPRGMAERVYGFLAACGVPLALGPGELDALGVEIGRGMNRARAAAQGDTFSTYDGATFIHGRHVSDDPAPGKWRRVFPRERWDELEAAARPVREALGYGGEEGTEAQRHRGTKGGEGTEVKSG